MEMPNFLNLQMKLDYYLNLLNCTGNNIQVKILTMTQEYGDVAQIKIICLDILRMSITVF